jgi:hypothetical protein
MPTQIDSAGITFNDTTTLTSANIGTAQLVNGSVTESKLGTNEQKQICKAWVNFNGVTPQSANAASGLTLNVTSGQSTGTWVSTTSWNADWAGVIVYIPSIAGVSGATFGGLNVATIGFQITSVSGNTANVRFLAGNATSSQSIVGNGTSTGYTFTTSGIRSSYNVSSVTKNATGDYTVNFATPMADANYSISGLGAVGTNGTRVTYLALEASSIPTINSFIIRNYPSGDGTGGNADTSYMNIQIFGN